MTWILFLLLGLALGAGVGYLIRQSLATKRTSTAEATAEKILNEAKSKEQQILLEAKEKAIKVLDEVKRDEQSRRVELSEYQKKLEKRESLFDQKILELQTAQQKILDKEKLVDEAKAKVEAMAGEEMKKLEAVAKLTTEEAKDRLLKIVEERYQNDLMSRIRKIEQEDTETVETKAREILMPVIERMGASVVSDTTTTNVSLPSDDLKGRIIGREGRNIKVLEYLTGCEIVVDDTPGMITVSGFSPIRRQITKRALDKLLKDGRIQPARIEGAVEEAKKELAQDIKKAGEDALFQVGVAGVDPKLVQILGRLKYRTSYGQNVLNHSIEVAFISGMLAEELGANVSVAKRGGLFHDIGKAVDHDVQGGHPEIGYNILKKFGMPEEVAYNSLGHHEDKPKTLEAEIVKAADAISGARPGARKDSVEQYVQRLEDLEKTAASFPGVEKAYAIAAGREVRVFVRPQEIDDFAAVRLAQDVARKIEAELQYPGEIRVTIIRETRIVEYAK
jgi:ribonuclease Y